MSDKHGFSKSIGHSSGSASITGSSVGVGQTKDLVTAKVTNSFGSAPKPDRCDGKSSPKPKGNK